MCQHAHCVSKRACPAVGTRYDRRTRAATPAFRYRICTVVWCAPEREGPRGPQPFAVTGRAVLLLSRHDGAIPFLACRAPALAGEKKNGNGRGPDAGRPIESLKVPNTPPAGNLEIEGGWGY
eukprot:gene7922-biopygen19598